MTLHLPCGGPVPAPQETNHNMFTVPSVDHPTTAYFDSLMYFFGNDVTKWLSTWLSCNIAECRLGLWLDPEPGSCQEAATGVPWLELRLQGAVYPWSKAERIGLQPLCWRHGGVMVCDRPSTGVLRPASWDRMHGPTTMFESCKSRFFFVQRMEAVSL